MKRLIYAVALIGIASVGFSFMTKESKGPLGDDPYCVKIYSKKTGTFYETIVAQNAGRAKLIAQQRYPNCDVGYPSVGPCK